MKQVFKIAKAELQNLFYSPVAWLVIVIFAYQLAQLHAMLILQPLQQQNLGGHWGYLTLVSSQIISSVLGYLYLYVPLITMSVISREFSSGSIKLFYSSPITNRQFVLGKYLGLVIYLLSFVILALLSALYDSTFIKNYDWGIMLPGILAFYLLICVYAAIGLFMSSLTSYVVVAAMGTLMILSFLSYVGTLSQNTPVLSDITYWLSINSRTNNAFYGLISSEDILYFLLIILCFIFLTIIKLYHDRNKDRFLVKVGHYSIIVIAISALGYVTSRPTFKKYADFSRSKQNTITISSQAVLNKFKGRDLTIITYVNLFDKNFQAFSPFVINNDKLILEPFIRFKPEISAKYIFYYHRQDDTPTTGRTMKEDYKRAETICDNYGLKVSNLLSPIEIEKQINLRPEEFKIVRLLKSGDRKTFLRLYDDVRGYPEERETTAALKRLIMPLKHTGVISSNASFSIYDETGVGYHTFANRVDHREALTNQGMEVDTLNLNELKTIPDSIDILMIAGNKIPFSDKQEAIIQNYLDKGGNIFINVNTHYKLSNQQLLSNLGVSVLDGYLYAKHKYAMANVVFSQLTDAGAKLSYLLQSVRDFKSFIVMKDVAPLNYLEKNGFKAVKVFQTSENYNIEKQLLSNDMLADYKILNPSTAAKYTTVLALYRNINHKQQRIVISADAGMLSNSALTDNYKEINTANNFVSLGFFDWLSYGEVPSDNRRPVATDNHLNITLEQFKVADFIASWILPGLISIVAAIILIIRRKT